MWRESLLAAGAHGVTERCSHKAQPRTGRVLPAVVPCPPQTAALGQNAHRHCLRCWGPPRGLEHLPWVPRRPWRLKSASGRPLSASRLPALGAPMTSGSLAEAELSRWTPVPCLSSGAETASASSRIGACPASAPTAPEMGTLPVGAAGPSSGLKMLPSETAAG